MSLDVNQGRVVHMPADPNKFAFDGEVSAIFPDMAKRAIPNFYEAHDAHARMLKRWMLNGASVLDVGASRGAFFHALHAYYPEVDLSLSAIDNSADMCHYLRADWPKARVYHTDMTSGAFLASPIESYDVVCCHYVLQFIEPELQMALLLKLISMVRPGGVFIFGHKSRAPGYAGDAANGRYIDFRVANGYTEEEIEAKTRALRGSMWPMDHERVMNTLRSHFAEVQETFRFMMFSTVFAVK